MEEFHEAEILWPEIDQGGKRCTENYVRAGKARTHHGVRTTLPELPKYCTSGFNYSDTHRYIHDDDNDDGNGYNGGVDAGGTRTKGMVPPHILISNRHADKMVFSVCAGNGRTLKGRDLSVMRDSVLRLTGYIEK